MAGKTNIEFRFHEFNVKKPKCKLTKRQREVNRDERVHTLIILLSVLVLLHAIWSYNERWDFARAGSSLFLPRFSGLTFFRFLGPFFIFSEIFASGVLYFLLVCEPGHRKLSFTLSNVYTQE